MDIDEKELFDSALTDEAPQIEAEAPAEQPAAEDEGQLRDEQGRFAAKQPEPEPQPEPQPAPQAQQPAKEEVHVPSWRLREEREAREAAERRAADIEAHFQRQFAELQARLPKQEPQKVPDLYEDPNAFVQHGVQQVVDPIRSEVQQLREYYSWQNAVRDHGADKAKAAKDEFAKAVQSGDAEAQAVLERSMRSLDPFSEVVRWHQQRTVYQQIGGDPQAWAQKWLEEQLSDPKTAGEIMQKIQQSTRQPGNPQVQNKIQLAPSLRSVPSAQSPTDDDNDVSDAGLFRYALR